MCLEHIMDSYNSKIKEQITQLKLSKNISGYFFKEDTWGQYKDGKTFNITSN